MAQYRELEAFAQFASDSDEASKEQEHGVRVTELTKQDQFSPMSVAEMGLMLYTANEGYLREVEVEKIKDFEKTLLSYMNAEHKDLMTAFLKQVNTMKKLRALLKKLWISLCQLRLGKDTWLIAKK